MLLYTSSELFYIQTGKCQKLQKNKRDGCAVGFGKEEPVQEQVTKFCICGHKKKKTYNKTYNIKLDNHILRFKKE